MLKELVVRLWWVFVGSFLMLVLCMVGLVRDRTAFSDIPGITKDIWHVLMTGDRDGIF
jgi:hypothetical protein